MRLDFDGRKESEVRMIEDTSWAKGCSECEYGLVMSPPIPKNAISLAIARYAQAKQGDLVFCECRAGKAYRHHLLGDSKPDEYVPPMRLVPNPVEPRKVAA